MRSILNRYTVQWTPMWWVGEDETNKASLGKLAFEGYNEYYAATYKGAWRIAGKIQAFSGSMVGPYDNGWYGYVIITDTRTGRRFTYYDTDLDFSTAGHIDQARAEYEAIKAAHGGL